MAKQIKVSDKTKLKQWDAKPSHKVIHTVVTIVVTLALVGGGIFTYIFFMNDTEATIDNSKSRSRVVQTISSTDTTKQTISEASFTFNLPADWKRVSADLSGPYKKYTYQAGVKNAENRYLYIYADGQLPPTLAFNKAVSVHAEGQTMSHGSVSENCADFTTQTTPKQLQIKAKWEGVDFLCDMDATGRNVAGTSSTENLDQVVLTDTGFTPHRITILYEDNNANPDYNIFYGVLDSFSVK
jgi:hypothetical protein